MQIKNIFSHKILGSASSWTIQTRLELADGSYGFASVPGGLSRGGTEAVAIPADQAVNRVGEIKQNLIGKEFNDQKEFDSYLMELDGTEDKSNLGGNTMISLSMAFCKAMAKAHKLETYQYITTQIYPDKNIEYKWPQMMMLIMEGGLHGSGAATIQEFMAIVDSLDRGLEIYNNVKNELHELGQSTNVGAEGAFSPSGYDNDQILTVLSGFLHGEQIALDIAANSFAEFKNNPPLPDYDSFLKNYPIYSLEDIYGEDDWTNWELFSQKYLYGNTPKPLVVIADDLTTTNPKILKKAIEKKVANGIIIKPNQIGTVTETLEVVRMAQENSWKTIVSHRGTDTNDDFIADLAVGVGADFTKFGAPARGERVAKYNRLVEIFQN